MNEIVFQLQVETITLSEIKQTPKDKYVFSDV